MKPKGWKLNPQWRSFDEQQKAIKAHNAMMRAHRELIQEMQEEALQGADRTPVSPVLRLVREDDLETT